MQPTPDEVRAALERVLASSSFTGTSRLTRFLRFVVEQALAGEAERLKEYVIGVEVFDRDERYDPRIDSIVRVEAGRLRAKLDEYYRGAGAGDGVQIVIEKGSYAPELVRRAEAPRVVAVPSMSAAPGGALVTPAIGSAPFASASVESAAVRARTHSSTRQRLAVAAIVAVIGAALAIGVASWRSAQRGDTEPPRAVVAVLPFTTYAGDADGRMLATRLTDSVTAELVRLGRFSVVASSAARPFADSRAPPHDIARDLHADLLLQARVNAQDGNLTVAALLVDGAHDRKLWFDTVTGDVADLDDLARRVAVAVAGSPLNAPP